MRTGREALVFVSRSSERGKEVLLTHRCPKLGGFWHAVAGGAEKDEDGEAAAKRELLEETGLEAGGKFDSRRHSYSYPLSEVPPVRRALYTPGTQRISVECFRIGAPTDWEPVLNWEHDAYRWCGVGEALALLRWPTVSEALIALSRASKD
ncbi:MAG: NUDIX domain-containing protein [Gaiellaceae bacterium]|jgi:8-oxo-dGTP pyrophosphatase MutT (NUDIX family)